MSNESLSNLVVKLDGQLLSVEDWNSHTPPMNFELWDGMPFTNQTTQFRDRLLVALMYSAGIRHTLSFLPQKSLELLREELKEDWREIVAEADRLSRGRFAEEEGIRNMSRRMIENGMSIEEVSSLTGLSNDDLLRIANKEKD